MPRSGPANGARRTSFSPQVVEALYPRLTTVARRVVSGYVSTTSEKANAMTTSNYEPGEKMRPETPEQRARRLKKAEKARQEFERTRYAGNARDHKGNGKKR